MRRGRWAEDPEALRRSARDRVISVAALVGLGVPGPTVARRCQDGGPWRRLLPGIVLLGSGPATRQQEITAALMYGGPDALVTGLEACRRHGVRRGPEPPGKVHLLVPEERQLKGSEFVVVERTTRLPPASCGTVSRLTPLSAPANHRDSRRVLFYVSEWIRSTAERDAKRLVARSGLPAPWWNVPVYDERGRLLGIADAWFDEVALAWEINSYAWQLNPESYAREITRTADMTAANVVINRPRSPTALHRDPDGSMATLVAAYAAAARRPRPPVRARAIDIVG
jgi:hypothetical protein